MNSKVLCFASSKGGSGKTILTANIASFLTELGKKVLMIDCDAATHGLTLLYLVEVSNNSNKNRKGIFETSSGSELHESLKDSVISVENKVDLLPATYNFSPGFTPDDFLKEDSFSDIINALKSKYDFILLDAQAGSDNYSRLAMKQSISDEVIIVSEYDPLSAAGIERLKQVIGDDLDYTRTWVLLNKMLPEFVDKFSEFLSITKYLSPIPWNADVVRSYAKRKLALDLEKGNVFTLSIMRSVSALLGEQIEDDIAGWAEKRSYALKEPLEVQYADAEKELKFLLQAQQKLEIKHKTSRLILMYFVLIPIFALPWFIKKIFAIGVFENSIMLETLQRFLAKLDSTGTLILFVAFTLPFFYPILIKIFKSEKTTEGARYARQIQLSEEQLKKLEALRSADFETIIKKNISNERES